MVIQENKNIMWFIIAGLTRVTCDMVDYKHVTAMADYALRLREQLQEITEEVNQILSAKGYPTTCRGTIEVKGKGTMQTFFLDGPTQPDLMKDPLQSASTPTTNITVNPLANLNEKQAVSNTPLLLGTISEKN
ncbi:unnamed protein product [Acanthoscelides obtectus]|uniref:Guanylate cyclase domain-containing protein n=1 Tax=Acanthoscelides obtectus TaxID=200917 RepID=A0A9P0QE83_ACAOB|nr:unnamed protein product [Acanthoscelides obtectus]CAK1641096.1 Adenylate cyclase type 6 [Acanthoscelides obtectus]